MCNRWTEMSEALTVRTVVAARTSATALVRGRPRQALGVVVLAGAYYGAAQLGFALELAGPVAAIVWLPVGVGISFLYLGGLALWPGVLIGDLLVNDYGAMPLGSALGQTGGNVLEVVLAAVLLRRLVPFGSPLESIGGITRMLVALVVGTMVSATIGTVAQLLGDVIESPEITTVWRTWWLGDLTGALVLVPLAIAWRRRPPPGWLNGRRLEAALLIGTIAVVSELASATSRPIMYIVFPPLIWAALRFGQRGATLSVAIAVGFAVWNASQNVGPFVFESISHMVLSTQLFIGVAALTTLFLAAVVSEREAFAEGLRASRARLVEASEIERRRLLHNLHDGAQQRLTALVVHLRLAAERQDPTPAESTAALDRAGNELLLAIEELRELAHGLHPALLARLGLATAVKGIAARASVPVTLAELPDVRLDDAAEATAYYVVAEAVANAQKHARASAITVGVGLRHDVLRVEVADDGAGGAFESPGSGLQGLRDRVEALGGSFAIDSSRAGTRITARIPVLAAR
jgi:signal transduction histidine kinase